VIPDAHSSEKAIQGLKDTNGVYFVPAFVGLGAPYWDAEARGIICGLTRGANAGHIIRAGLESIACQTKDVFDLMQKAMGRKISSLKVDGGACRNNFLMQFQADMLGCRVVRPRMTDSTASGVAYLAGLTAGVWDQKDLKNMNTVDRIFSPAMPARLVQEKYSGWLKAVERAIGN